MSYEKSLRNIAQALPQEPLPHRLHSRVMGALPEISAPPPILAPLTFVGIAAAILGTMVTLHYRTSPKSYTSPNYMREMYRATESTTTWHFVGWRWKEGKAAHWEIWGRRSPFLYREQIGDEVILDDGKTRRYILPPDANRPQDKGTVVIIPSQSPPMKAHQETNVQFLAGIREDTRSFSCAKRSDGSIACHTLTGPYPATTAPPDPTPYPFTVTVISNQHTHLPVRYALDRPWGEYLTSTVFKPGTKKCGELMTAFNGPFPRDNNNATVPREYQIVDTTKTSHEIYHQIRSGVVLSAEVMHKDQEGNLQIRLHYWMDAPPPLYSPIPSPPWENSTDHTRWGFSVAPSNDSEGHLYYDFSPAPIERITSQQHDGWFAGQYDLWLTPEEPITTETASNRMLTADITATNWDGETVNFEMSLPLPATTTAVDLPKYANRMPTLRQVTAERRAKSYDDPVYSEFARAPKGQEPLHLSPDANRRLERGIYWHRVAVEEARRIGDEKSAVTHEYRAMKAQRLMQRLTSTKP